MFIFYKVHGLQRNAARAAIYAITDIAGVTGFAQGFFTRQGVFDITVYYQAGMPDSPSMRERLRQSLEGQLRHHLRSPDIRVEMVPPRKAS